jgi:hypothetical protein
MMIPTMSALLKCRSTFNSSLICKVSVIQTSVSSCSTAPGSSLSTANYGAAIHNKIVVPKEKRYELLKEVHEILGHKKIYTVWLQLLERFWWPFLDQDVKWFVHTCHHRQMCYHHILPNAATPASLFCKAHIDTMYMPHCSGY